SLARSTSDTGMITASSFMSTVPPAPLPLASVVVMTPPLVSSTHRRTAKVVSHPLESLVPRRPGSGPGMFTGAKGGPAAHNAGMTTTTGPLAQFRTVNGVRIRYADNGGPHETTVLLTNPWPESLFAFASMWATLAEHARLFAIDLPGFGA